MHMMGHQDFSQIQLNVLGLEILGSGIANSIVESVAPDKTFMAGCVCGHLQRCFLLVKPNSVGVLFLRSYCPFFFSFY